MLRRFTKLFNHQMPQRSKSTHQGRRCPLHLESLEERWVPATLVVDPNSPFKVVFHTITAAVDAAKNGDVIKVAPGTYDGDIDVTKSLTIIGGQRVNTLLDPVAPSVIKAGLTGEGFSFGANNIVIKNFTIQGMQPGITTNGFTGFTITNNVFLDDAVGISMTTSLASTAAASTVSGNFFVNDGQGPTPLDDILSAGARNVTIKNNRFQVPNTDAAIHVNGASLSSNMQIVDNFFSGDSQILVANVTKAKIDGNTILTPSRSNLFPAAIHLGGTVSISEVANNTLLNLNTTTSFEGIILDDTDILGATNTSNTITGNQIDGFRLGILVNLASKNTISSNVVVRSLDSGLSVAGIFALGNTITANKFVSNHGNGMDVISTTATSANLLSKNTTVGNTGNGIFLNHAQGTTVSGNTACRNTGAGIALDTATGNTLSTNTANYNGPESPGIRLLNSSHNTLTGNVASHNGDQGILLVGSQQNTLSGNTAEFNSTDGIALGALSNQNTFTSNVVRFNSSGISLDHSSSNVFTTNTANRNVQSGFALSGGSNLNTFTSNTANNNNGGFFALNCNTNTFTKNTANNNLGSGGAEGFLISGVSNTLTGNTANNNVLSGFQISGNANLVSGNVASGNGRSGFAILSGSNDTVTLNTASSNGLARVNTDADGFIFGNLTGSNVSGNTATNNVGNGIEMASSASGNTITGNTATGNGDSGLGFDLFDGSNTTTQNTWTGNTAGKRNPTGLG